jgi:hypothetical protein
MYTKFWSAELKVRDRMGNRNLENNIKIEFRWTGREVGDLIELAQDRAKWRPYFNTVMNFRFRKCMTFFWPPE